MMLRNWARLYTKPTPAENALEPAIAALGERYRVQHPFFSLHLIADFVLLDSRVVVEVDGKSHDTPKQIRKDLQHMIALEERGWAVVRIRNEQAISNPGVALSAALGGLHSRPGLEQLRSVLAALPDPGPRLTRAGRKPRKPVRGPRVGSSTRLVGSAG